MISQRALILALSAALAVPAMVAAQADPATTARSSATSLGPNDSVTTPDSAGAAANSSGVVTDVAPMTPSQVQALRSGDNAVVTNGPVPDTPENRAKYGGPISNGGRKTPPAGN